MALTPTQWQDLITSELSPKKLTKILSDEGAAEDEFATNLPLWWEANSDRAVWGIRLRYLYTKRQAIAWLTGQTWDHIDYGDADVNERLSQYIEHLQTMAQDVDGQIVRIEARRRSTGGKVGTITKKAPIEATDVDVEVSCTDPNDRVYRGDTLRRRMPSAYPR